MAELTNLAKSKRVVCVFVFVTDIHRVKMAEITNLAKSKRVVYVCLWQIYLESKWLN